jgi:acetyltransferase-like isoleucine patch superfamily enzyme
MLKKIYLSPLGYLISFIQNIFAVIQQPFMVYGFYNKVQKKFMKLTRISSSVKIISKIKLDISDNVWIGHYSILDASNGIKIGKGVQTGPFVSIFSHSSHISIRLLGESYLQSNERIGYIDGKVEIGDYSFIGTSTVILPNVVIGKGCLIKVGSVVTKSIPDYSIVSGNPATVEGSISKIDEKYFNDKVVIENYFDKKIIENWQKN